MESSSFKPTPRRHISLEDVLLERELILPDQLAKAREQQQQTGESLSNVLIEQGYIVESQLLPVLSEQWGVPLVSLSEASIDATIISKVPAATATRYSVMPVAFEDEQLLLASSDPLNIQVLDELNLLLQCEIKPVLASSTDIQEAIHRHYGIGASSVERLLDTAELAPTQTSNTEDLTGKAEEASVISFVNQIILSAVHDRATDIHFEPFATSSRIRQRIDGVVYEVPIPADLVKLHQAIVSRIKVMAKLDIAEKRLPQDGRIKVKLEGQELDLRISILPTSFGESVNIRLLSAGMLYSMEQLGLEGDQLPILVDLLKKSHGIMFVTGPTGSGKTTTLYSCLTKLNSPNVNILTIEDPVEYQLYGITQLQVHPKIGFSFAAGLRSMLRHDPDIMMVGEVRDPETAEITIRSALTGHLVFSTLHTNDAAGGVNRLLDMGIEPYLVASSVLCFIAQRLVRVICSSCTEEKPVDKELIREFGLQSSARDETPTYRVGKGCAACKGTGYKGRTAIYEFLVMDDAIQQLILQRTSSREIAVLAQKNGMRTLRHDGWRKIKQGVTTPEEVLRVT